MNLAQCPSVCRYFAPFSFIIALAAAVVLAGPRAVHAAEKHWLAGNGLWNNNANWFPAGIPAHHDNIHIGTIPGVQNHTVTMGNGVVSVIFDYLELTGGMTLDLNGSELVSVAVAEITGAGTHLITRPAPAGGNTYDFWATTHLGPGAKLELRDNSLVHLGWGGWNEGLISGRGTVLVGVDFRNDGVIEPGGNGGLTFDSAGVGLDLDGSSGNGHLQLNTPFSQLLVNGSSLDDSFSGTLTMTHGALLTMDIADGWTADAGAEFNILGTNNPAAASQINGNTMFFGGELNVGANQAHLRVLATTVLQPNSEFNIAPGGLLEFDGVTWLNGGTFYTASNNPINGVVDFNSTTYWDGTVNVNGIIRHRGNFAAVLGTTVINTAGSAFAMNGVWGVGYNTTVNASQVTTSASVPGQFDTQIIIPGGLVPRLTVNLADPNASWSMNGLMNLEGETVLYETRVAGSHMLMNGELDLSTGRVNITADTTFSALPSGADVNIGSATSILRMMGDTFVGGATNFTGFGTLQNGPPGAMTLDNGVVLNAVGFVNQGHLFIRRDDVPNVAGLVSVDRFTNESGATWQVRIGGYAPGNDHDQIVVTSGAATLNGNLQIAQFNAGGVPFNPQVGDEFTILTAVGGVAGNITVAPTACLNGNIHTWSVIYGPNDVRVRLDAIGLMPGDMNCDCRVNGLDIQPFTHAVNDPVAYAIANAECNVYHADVNVDGIVNIADINPFIQLLTGNP